MLDKIKQRKNNGLVWLFCVTVSSLFLMICSKSSFLYPMNDWVDVNCYMTIAKAMLDGKVLYADIYDQKGPLLYMIHCIAVLISDHSFIGVFLIEVACFTVTLRYAYKIAELYLKKSAICTIPIFAAVVLPARSFAHGDSAEELCLPLLMISLYIMVDHVKNQKEFKKKTLILVGVLAGCVFWIKFSMIGFFVGFMMAVVYFHLCDKQWKAMAINIGSFLLGMGIATIPYLLYFGYHNAIGDFLTGYLYNNIFMYKTVEITSFWHRLSTIGVAVFDSALDNLSYFSFIIIGLLGIWIANKSLVTYRLKIAITLIAIWLPLGVYWGGVTWIYYGFIFNVLTIIGIIVVFVILENRWAKLSRFVKPFTVLCIIVGVIISYFASNNTYLMKFNREDMPQYKFAKIINQTPDATLLNYDFLDGGFYFAADTLPVNRFFCLLNIGYEEMHEELDRVVEEGMVDYVVTRNSNYLFMKYQLISTETFEFEGVMNTYYLYQKKDL